MSLYDSILSNFGGVSANNLLDIISYDPLYKNHHITNKMILIIPLTRLLVTKIHFHCYH